MITSNEKYVLLHFVKFILYIRFSIIRISILKIYSLWLIYKKIGIIIFSPPNCTNFLTYKIKYNSIWSSFSFLPIYILNEKIYFQCFPLLFLDYVTSWYSIQYRNKCFEICFILFIDFFNFMEWNFLRAIMFLPIKDSMQLR